MDGYRSDCVAPSFLVWDASWETHAMVRHHRLGPVDREFEPLFDEVDHAGHDSVRRSGTVLHQQEVVRLTVNRCPRRLSS